MKHVYLVVEGPHDVEFVARLLKPSGLKRVQKFALLDPYWIPLVPTEFPHGGDLTKRVPVPMFFASEEVSLAIDAAGGDSRVAPTIEETLAVPLSAALDGIGALLDADSEKSPTGRFEAVSKALGNVGLTPPNHPGVATTGTPRCGIFVLPDNVNTGTLEDLLLEGAALGYPSLLEAARAFVGAVNPGWPELGGVELKDLNKPAGRNKAVIASMVGILKPGKAVQVSIQDNRWLEGASLALPRIVEIQRFLLDLLGLPATP